MTTLLKLLYPRTRRGVLLLNAFVVGLALSLTAAGMVSNPWLILLGLLLATANWVRAAFRRDLILWVIARRKGV